MGSQFRIENQMRRFFTGLFFPEVDKAENFIGLFSFSQIGVAVTKYFGLRVLGEENQSLRSSERNKWFAIGALVLLCGLVFGMIVGRQQKKRRYY